MNIISAHTNKKIEINKIARMALAMYDHNPFFSIRRKLDMRFSRDFNGSGRQCLFIKREDDKAAFEGLIKVFFEPTYSTNGEFLYEADLFKDQNRDYKPTVNRGKHRFVADSAVLNIDWNSDEIQLWCSDVERLTKSSDTLDYWIENDLEMQVGCVSIFCREPSRFTLSDLKQFVAMGVTLEELKSRLTCSTCGKRGARISVFR